MKQSLQASLGSGDCWYTHMALLTLLLQACAHTTHQEAMLALAGPAVVAAVHLALQNRLSHSRERDISGMPGGNFITSGTNVHLDSRMNWLEFGGQRSKVTVTSQNTFLAITQEFMS